MAEHDEAVGLVERFEADMQAAYDALTKPDPAILALYDGARFLSKVAALSRLQPPTIYWDTEPNAPAPSGEGLGASRDHAHTAGVALERAFIARVANTALCSEGLSHDADIDATLDEIIGDARALSSAKQVDGDKSRDDLNPLPSSEETAKLVSDVLKIADWLSEEDDDLNDDAPTLRQAAAHLTTQSAEIARLREELKEAGTYTEAHARLDALAREQVATAEAERDEARRSWDACKTVADNLRDQISELSKSLAAARAREQVLEGLLSRLNSIYPWPTSGPEAELRRSIRQALQQQDGSNGR
jgi:DNA repair exonuclease SbcCD ATPase subunit